MTNNVRWILFQVLSTDFCAPEGVFPTYLSYDCPTSFTIVNEDNVVLSKVRVNTRTPSEWSVSGNTSGLQKQI